MKRGMNSIVSIILIVFLGLVIGGIIFIWQVNLSENIQKDNSIRQLCSTLDFRVDDFCYQTMTSVNLDMIEEQFTVIQFNAKNDGNPEIIEFLLILTDKFGNSVTYSILNEKKISNQQGDTFTSDGIFDKEIIDKISIVPRIMLDEGKILCEDEKKIIDKEEIGIC
jgi:hypothetical protein